ncbi:Uncharacterised protein [Mycobacterium tuberculosis]|nr:hypothetical protein BIT17_3373 [Mycobacterium tuberculosis variant bovis]COW64292.1 Uncharacterised protein [Mycobacterium tuberculosis]
MTEITTADQRLSAAVTVRSRYGKKTSGGSGQLWTRPASVVKVSVVIGVNKVTSGWNGRR